MVTQQTAIIETKNFIKDLKSIGINLRKVLLFGSFVNQRQHEHSDIDVALVADEFIGVGPVDIKLFVEVLRNYKLIHAKTYSSSEFEEGDPFIDEIKKTGMEIELN
jgi:predicted nucleotidyltransferase